MQRLSLDEGNDYLANDPNINKLKEFTKGDLQELEPKFAAIAVEGNAFEDEIKLYLKITQEMGLTPHIVPTRVDRNPDVLA